MRPSQFINAVMFWRPMLGLAAVVLPLGAANLGCTAIIQGDEQRSGSGGGTNIGSASSSGESGTAIAGIGGMSASGGGSTALDAASIAPEPLHRLNRLEYDSTVRDLLGTALSPAVEFPARSRERRPRQPGEWLDPGLLAVRPLCRCRAGLGGGRFERSAALHAAASGSGAPQVRYQLQ